MVTKTPVSVPLTATFDPAHGGRWTALASAGREWLWHNPAFAFRGTPPLGGAPPVAPARDGVRPGDAFVDAGGLEECLPTVRGRPDHGDVWSRPWRVTGPGAAVAESAAFVLTRRIAGRSGTVVADYDLTAQPGYRFIWAAHALLELSPAAELLAPAGTPTRVDPGVVGAWPAPAGVRLDRLGPDDGTAVGAVLLDCPRVAVVDGADRLTLELECDDQPRSTALWRNLRGWPAGVPYRSIGVEPMLGRTFELACAGPDDAAVVPASGAVAWRLSISAHRVPGEPAP